MMYNLIKYSNLYKINRDQILDKIFDDETCADNIKEFINSSIKNLEDRQAARKLKSKTKKLKTTLSLKK